MKNTLNLLLLLTTLTAVPCFGCTRAGYDYLQPIGFYRSDPNYPCGPASGEKVESMLHPGFFVRQSDGKLTVSNLLPGSPAEASGLRIGDEIQNINGSGVEAFFLQSDNNSWKGDGLGHSVLTVSRAGKTFRTTVTSLPIRTYLDRLWLLDNTKRLVSAGAGGKVVDFGASFYTLGFRIESRGSGDVRVANLIAGGPAQLSGLRIGDRVVSLDGAKMSRKLESLDQSNAATAPLVHYFLVQRGSRIIPVKIEPMSIPQMMLLPTRRLDGSVLLARSK